MTCFGSFAIFDDLWWPLMTYDDLFWPRDQFFSKASVKSFILTYNLFTLWSLKFDLFSALFWPLLTLFDLKTKFNDLFWKALAKSFILRYNLYTFDKNQNLTFWGLFRDFWPLLTFSDFETNFFEKLSSRASFWCIICLLLTKIKIWPF